MERILILLLISMSAYAEKKYSQKEFDEEVTKRVVEQLKRYKKESIVDLAKGVLERESKVKEREQELKAQVVDLKKHQVELTETLAKVNQAKGKILNCRDQNERERTARIRKMAKVIEGMKPDKAGEILAVQTPEIAVQMLRFLPEEKLAKIFNKMSSKNKIAAEEISARLHRSYLTMKK